MYKYTIEDEILFQQWWAGDRKMSYDKFQCKLGFLAGLRYAWQQHNKSLNAELLPPDATVTELSQADTTGKINS